MDKKHWYDGLFYSFFIDRGGEPLRELISGFVKKGSSVIDVACGTGALAFHLSRKCSRIAGVELSSEMFRFAQQFNNYENVEFHHLDAKELSNFFSGEFDYAVICFALHEMGEDERVKVLNEMKRVAERLIIVDFAAPLPAGFNSHLIRLVEFFAGGEHYKNHKSFMKNGGVKDLLNRCGLRIVKVVPANPNKSSLLYFAVKNK